MTSDYLKGSVRYARAVDLDDLGNPHTLAVLIAGREGRVLDIGAATGSVAGALREHGARVWGVEIDEAAASEAAKVCEQVVVGDVEQLDLDSELNQHEFDWLLFLDLLEHLRDPLAVLKRCLSLLAPGGRVLISLPNVAHRSVRLQLLRGHFRYTEIGLLDRTHLRFFDQDSVRELLADAGLCIEEELPIRHPADEEDLVLDDVPPDLVRELDGDPTSDIYQFFVVARSADAVSRMRVSENGRVDIGVATTLVGRLWKRLNELEKQVRGGERYVGSLLEQIGGLESRAERAEELERAIAERMRELAARDRELKQLRLTVGLKERQLVDVREQFAGVRDQLDAAQAELAGATAEAANVPPLREHIAALEWQHAEMVKRLQYGRYRAADWLSGVVKGTALHRFARFFVESIFGRRRR
ncbi:MAG TPA: methyltransferase domain-containing protein [Solirubrobacteraceae bacterium]|nr:methyltransferase domain-containing protein [Solirubrobacteraceae bacterium]